MDEFGQIVVGRESKVCKASIVLDGKRQMAIYWPRMRSTLLLCHILCCPIFQLLWVLCRFLSLFHSPHSAFNKWKNFALTAFIICFTIFPSLIFFFLLDFISLHLLFGIGERLGFLLPYWYDFNFFFFSHSVFSFVAILIPELRLSAVGQQHAAMFIRNSLEIWWTLLSSCCVSKSLCICSSDD